jgi:hypothetical protein
VLNALLGRSGLVEEPRARAHARRNQTMEDEARDRVRVFLPQRRKTGDDQPHT